VLRQLLIGALDPRLVPTGDDDAALKLVGDERGRDAAEERERADVARDEVGAALRQRRLGEGVVRRAEHRDEELDLDPLAGLRIDDVRLLPGVVDEELLAGAVLLPHREVALVEPLAVPLAELRVAVTVRMLLQILEVEQLERHARLPALDVEVRAVRHRPIAGRRDGWVELRLQRVVRERLDRGPVEPGRDRASDRPRDRADRHADRLAHLSVAPAERPLLPENLSRVAHGQSLRRHAASGEGGGQRGRRPASLRRCARPR